eukprot:4360497-Prymnesium_polylepis.2
MQPRAPQHSGRQSLHHKHRYCITIVLCCQPTQSLPLRLRLSLSARFASRPTSASRSEGLSSSSPSTIACASARKTWDNASAGRLANMHAGSREPASTSLTGHVPTHL